MKLKIIALSAIFLATAWAPAAMASAAGSGLPQLKITYDMSGLPLTITYNGDGIYTFEGLPYPGQVLYTPENGVVYYQHPEDPAWHSITPAMLKSIMVPAYVTAGPAGAPWQGQTTTRWNISADSGKESTKCPITFGSPGAAAMSGLNISDIHLVLTALQWLAGGDVTQPCEKLQFSAENANKIGLPTQFTGPNGAWQLQEIVQTSATEVTLPNAYPLDDTTRLSFLLVQFSPEERASLLQKFGNLPVLQQIQAISALLTQENL